MVGSYQFYNNMMNLKSLLFFVILNFFTQKCFSQLSDVCNTCVCETKPNENDILYIKCSHAPKFQKMIESKSWDKPPDIYLSFDQMNLTTIQRYVKFETVNVKKISLDDNKIKSIPSYIFSKFNNLTSLSLVNNEIDDITQESFKGLENLKSLNMSYNALNTFDTVYLNDLKELEILDLRGNLLTNFYSTSLIPKMNLRNLDISNNKLTNFPEKALKLFDDLINLNLNKNKIKFIPRGGFEYQVNLDTLDLSNNQLADIDFEAFPDINHIKVLYLNNNLVSNTKFILKLQSLLLLDLSYNSITSLNTSLWSQKLTELNLGNNGLTVLDDILKGLPQLKVLNVSWNQCHRLPDNINSNLKSLILDENAIVSILPSRPTGNGSLTYLSLSELRHLKTLQRNAFNGVFSSNVKQEPCAKLVIKRTGLQYIEKDALKNLNICELDLSWNELIELPEDTFDWDRLQKIDLQGNPWHCTCSMQWLLDKVVTKMYHSHQELLENLRCQTPKNLEGTRLVHWFNKSEPMLCSQSNTKEENIITITSSPAMIALDIMFGVIAVGLVATGFYLQRRMIRQRRLRKNRRF